MDKKLKRLWVSALRSGTIKKCRRAYIRNGVERCAIGVLAVNILGRRSGYNIFLAAEEHGLSKSEFDSIVKISDYTDLKDFEEVADWIELNIKED